MVLFRFVPANEALPVVRGEGLYLRAPQMADFAQWAALRAESRRFLEPWEPLWPSDDLTRTSFRRRVRRYAQEIASDTAYPFLIFRQEDDVLLGGLTLGFVRRGVAQTCTLGYWIGERHARQGYMTRAVRAAVGFAFRNLALRRVEAACLPSNAASIRLLEKVGFSREGYARRYLCIAGTWQDHLLYALLSDDTVS
ncbi:GNAT family N-acetyltransferase [Chelatococcus composti]|jgi:ribosomal-protein-alanine N-acetyltransferase|uniref:Ribosomal-protein-alanine N-acetyltransferase n=1 Tax=Chelatococcus composti TaxID=1743235 RepID=A0A841K6S2_9HYPH|nr:GNAT family protein [Chelatococcus composti]MBB6168518.1 ribosomal-protein-alanine N-acetyltransferase [Chelatococcus composti]MBS7736403.1 GNAT family N-acetyltransferase [Chelatococcus composti]PZN41970.1 MAG: 30S ribosomal protein S5 alanine N-acetyltransferase [Pseudomonadota bacterium]GGG40680.1 ribosomal-protein-alanine N-acetyltransferase [Chelatococcus composti]